MSHYKKLYPTRGDLAREQVRRKGFPFFMDTETEVAARLAALPPLSRVAFAVSCAERLMRAHEALPPTQQRPFTIQWRSVLNDVWKFLGSSDSDAKRAIEQALEEFHRSPYDHADGQEGPPDANEDAAAASIFAAECLAGGDPESANYAARRAVEAAFVLAEGPLRLDDNAFVWDPGAEPMPLAKAAMHNAVQGELGRQLRDLALLETEGLTAAVLQQLHAAA